MKPTALSDIPGVDEVLRCESSAVAIARFGRPAVTAEVRRHLARLRRGAVRNEVAIPSAVDVGQQVLETLEAGAIASVRPVFNLTGVVLHTNLGRAVLAEEAVEAAARAMRSPAALEFDLDTGGRGERDDHI